MGAKEVGSGSAPPVLDADVTAREMGDLQIKGSAFYDAAKRLFDLTVGALVLILLLPIIPLIAIMIKLDTPGSVFFKQDRVGKGGRVFRFYKFRSMYDRAEQQRAANAGMTEEERKWMFGDQQYTAHR